ncbi:MAG: bifunctional UDP-sugar hydrolase/5'-nucleotidase [Dethiobacteria bacterium]|nr:bifunctional UDP-sugar hydrolase/5'-nucleotidase [Dethiobacteria bacterium]
MTRKKFTILHSNDMHGDFIAEVSGESGELIGGLALLSGYINKVRREEENVLYVIAGDMVQGSIIDTEYKGISTMEIMNYLAPDVVALGNHEFDYGLPHLLFLEKMANFIIVNANLYIKKYNKRMMQPYAILKRAGFDILFTGIITEKVMDSLAQDGLIGSFITLKDAAEEVGRITNAYKNDDIDLTVVLTHIGFESDLELAKLMDPAWGVDIIIGGHSHTVLTKPAEVNNILIAQAGVGSKQLGRFDIVVDDLTNSIVDWQWELIPITSAVAEPDKELLDFIYTYKTEIEMKYSSIVTKLTHKHTHPKREIETDLGNLFADGLAEMADTDIMLVGSGSIREKELGPLVTLKDFTTCFPFQDNLTRFTVSGSKIWRAFNHIMRLENRNGEGECYQVNSAIKAVYSEKARQLISLQINGTPIEMEKTYRFCLIGYHLNNCKAYLDLTDQELREGGRWSIVSTSMTEVMEEWLINNQNTGRHLEGRLVYQD